MSKISKRKHVLREVEMDDFAAPTANQRIVRVVAVRGNNLHAVEDQDGSNYLVSMPPKFRKSIWIRRGNYVLIEPIEEGDKVKGEIVRILTKEHIKYFKNDNVWPAAFYVPDKEERKQENDDDDLPPNPNRRTQITGEDSEESDDTTSSSDSDS